MSSKSKRAPPGKIWRRGYTYKTKSGTTVKVAGHYMKKSKPKVRIKVKHPGSLDKYGYSLGKSDLSRHRALNKAVIAYGRTKTLRKVNLLYVYNKNKHPKIAAKARKDVRWLQGLS